MDQIVQVIVRSPRPVCNSTLTHLAMIGCGSCPEGLVNCVLRLAANCVLCGAAFTVIHEGAREGARWPIALVGH